MKKIGLIMIDIGGVIKTRVSENEGMWHTDMYRDTPLVNNCAKYLPLVRDMVEKKILIVSKSRGDEIIKVVQWYKHQRISKLTGIGNSQIIFWQNSREKADICKKYGVKAVVYNKPVDFLPILSQVKNLNLFSPMNEDLLTAQGNLLSLLMISYTWERLYQAISNQLEA